ncbi:autoinducer binding domain-containing protein [Ralstonia mannitolilytica]
MPSASVHRIPRRFSETAHDLRTAHGPQERQLLLRAALRSIGFDWLCYYRVTRIGESITRVLYFRAYSPPSWPKRYVDERYYEVDPRLAFALRYEWPLVWDLTDLGATPTAPADAERLHRLLQDAERAGLRSGISFGALSPAQPRAQRHLLRLRQQRQGLDCRQRGRPGVCRGAWVATNSARSTPSRCTTTRTPAPSRRCSGRFWSSSPAACRTRRLPSS